MQIDLTGKTALVTGATGQLGPTMARTLAQCGADVIVHYHRSAEKAESLAHQIESLGRKAFPAQADISSADSVQRMKQRIERDFAMPDILVTNAMISLPWKSVLEQSLADYQAEFAGCVFHNVLMAQQFVPAMIAKRYGRVIGINTECAMQSEEIHSMYVAAKRAMDGVLRVLAREIGPHQITVNQIAPGWIINQAADGDDHAYKQHVPLRRRGTPQDVANAVAFLASDLAAFISGVFLPVSGGTIMPAI